MLPLFSKKVGLRIGIGPGKTELILPEGYDKIIFSYPLDNPRIDAPHAVPGFSAYLGVLRHYSNDQDFIYDALKDL